MHVTFIYGKRFRLWHFRGAAMHDQNLAGWCVLLQRFVSLKGRVPKPPGLHIEGQLSVYGIHASRVCGSRYSNQICNIFCQVERTTKKTPTASRQWEFFDHPAQLSLGSLLGYYTGVPTASSSASRFTVPTSLTTVSPASMVPFAAPTASTNT